jgi:hypothetical protein
MTAQANFSTTAKENPMDRKNMYDPNQFVKYLLKTFEEIERIRNNSDLILKPANGERHEYPPILTEVAHDIP